MMEQQAIERIREIVLEMNFTTEFYHQLKEQVYSSKEEAAISSIKMKYAKEYVLRRSFELKRLLKQLEAHLQ